MTAAVLRASLARWRRRVAYRAAKLADARKTGHADAKLTAVEVARINKWKRNLDAAQKMVARREAQLAAKTPLRERAYKVAEGLIGVMEQGGNNAGPMVSKIIRENGGSGPEAWCGDFQSYNYRHAGSRAVQRGWAAVRLIGFLAGMRVVKQPLRGDLVVFAFDHVGMFSRDLGDGTIETIEGNTGASGAVSDSATGGDGVYRKVRAKSLVSRYVRVLR